MNMKRIVSVLFILVILPYTASAFDHEHSLFTSILDKHVSVLDNGLVSKVNYSALKKEHALLNTYLSSLSKVSQKEFSSWTKDQRLAFLINAYNGFTIDLILKNYPVKSIKKIGSILQSPWGIKFVSLFGKKISLDEIEHGFVRQKGVYDEPRIHFALVCASIGCPALQNKAFTSGKLEAMLEKSLVNFLSDKTRNRYVNAEKTFEISKIFKWYGGDFNAKYGSVTKLVNTYAKYLIKSEKELSLAEKIDDINYLDYDWNLNDTNSN